MRLISALLSSTVLVDILSTVAGSDDYASISLYENTGNAVSCSGVPTQIVYVPAPDCKVPPACASAGSNYNGKYSVNAACTGSDISGDAKKFGDTNYISAFFYTDSSCEDFAMAAMDRADGKCFYDNDGATSTKVVILDDGTVEVYKYSDQHCTTLMPDQPERTAIGNQNICRVVMNEVGVGSFKVFVNSQTNLGKSAVTSATVSAILLTAITLLAFL